MTMAQATIAPTTAGQAAGQPAPEAGDVLLVGAADSVPLDAPGTGYVLDGGTVDIVMQVGGRQRVVTRLEAGSFWYGGADDAAIVAWSAAAATLRRIAVADMLATGGDLARIARQAAQIDGWIESLAPAAPDGPADATCLRLAAGGEERAAGGTLLTAGQGVVWVLVAPGPDDPSPPLPIPLTVKTRHRLDRDADLVTCDSRALQLLPTAAAALDAFARAALAPLATALREEAAADDVLLATRRERTAEAARRASRWIASTMDLGEPAVAVDEGGSCPVFPHLAAVAASQGFPVRPVTVPQGGAPVERLLALCAGNNVRWRQITLTGAWWRIDSGDFVAVRSDGTLVAVTRGPRGYVVHDGPDGEARPFTPAMDAEWSGIGFALYGPLPDRPLRGGDVVAHVFRACSRDISTLLVLSAIAGVLALGVPAASGFLVGTIIPAQDRFALVEFGLVLTVLALTSFVLTVVTQVSTARIEARATTLVQSGTIDRLLRLPTGFFRSFSSGELAQRTMAISRLERMVSGAMINGLLSGIFSFFSFVLMFFYAPKLAILASGLSLLFIVVAVIAGRADIRASREQMEISGPVAQSMFEMAQGVEKLRLAAAEVIAFERWARLFHLQQTAAYRGDRVTARLDTFTAAFLSVATLAIFVFIGNTAASGAAAGAPALSTAALVAFLMSFTTFVASLGQFVAVATQFAAMKPVYDFAAPVLQAVPENNAAGTDPGKLKGSITLSGVRFGYTEDGPTILNGIDLHIEAGEYVAVVGDSGCGKSTILRLVMGFETPRSGSVAIDGHDLRAVDMRAVRRQFGVVMQNGRLMPGSIYDNIVGTNFGLPPEAVTRAAESVGLMDDIRAMPMGFQTTLNDSMGGLSGGQLQRILLARAIITEPPVLIFDEATSALDNRSQAIVTEALGKLSSTRIVVAHRLSTIRGVDRIVVLNKGRVVENGTYEQLLAAKGHFAALAARQIA